MHCDWLGECKRAGDSAVLCFIVQNVNELTSSLVSLNSSSETVVYNSSLVEAELDNLEQQLRVLEAQADDDAQLIHQVSVQFSSQIYHESAIKLVYIGCVYRSESSSRSPR